MKRKILSFVLIILFITIGWFLPRNEQKPSFRQLDFNLMQHYITDAGSTLLICVRPQDDWEDIEVFLVDIFPEMDVGEKNALAMHLMVKVICHWNMIWECRPVEALSFEYNTWHGIMKNGVTSPEHYPIYEDHYPISDWEIFNLVDPPKLRCQLSECHALNVTIQQGVHKGNLNWRQSGIYSHQSKNVTDLRS